MEKAKQARQVVGIKGLFGNADFKKLFIGQSISGLGDWIATFAFIALVYNITGNTSSVAVVLILRLIPPLFAAPVGGLLADRLPRRTIMTTCDIARGILIAFVPFVGLWGVYGIALVHEVISLFFLPSRDASIPRLASKENLEQANGLMMASSYGSLPIAGAFFSLLHNSSHIFPSFLPFSHLVNSQPTTLAFFFDAVSFIISGWLIWQMTPDKKYLNRRVKSTLKKDFTEGFSLFWRNKILSKLALGIIVAMFGGGVLFAIGIAYVRQTLGGSDATFGWLAALWGLGMALGLLFIRFFVRARGRLYIFVSSIAFCGGLLIAMALMPLMWLALILAIPFGIAFSLCIMLALTLTQSAVPSGQRGRMMGGVQMLYRLGLGAGALSMGFVAHSITSITIIETLDGNQFGMLVGGILILGGALWSFPLAIKNRDL
jgi:dTMP kinase